MKLHLSFTHLHFGNVIAMQFDSRIYCLSKVLHFAVPRVLSAQAV